MVGPGIFLIIESILVVAICLGATYTFHASHVSGELVGGIGYFYPFSSLHISVLIFSITSLFGISLLSIKGTKGLKWLMILVFMMCLPSIISRSGIPELISNKYMVKVSGISFLYSDISILVLLIISMSIVAGFILLHQLVMQREMYQNLTSQGIDKFDMVSIYKARGLSTITILLIAIGISYIVVSYSSDIKDMMKDSISVTPLVSVMIVILCASVTAAIIYSLLLRNKPVLESINREPEPGRSHKFADEVKNISAIVVPASVSTKLARLIQGTGYILFKPGYNVLKKHVFDRFRFLNKIRLRLQRILFKRIF